MVTNAITKSFSPVLCNNNKALALETSLQQSLVDFKELLIDFEQLHIESDKFKTQYLQQKQSCESRTCSGAEELKKVIESKDTIIQLVASALTRLSETKNWSIIDEIYKILFGDTSTSYPERTKCNQISNITTMKEEFLSPKKEIESPIEDLSFGDESVSEIEGTPTGRRSPIIPIKKSKTSTTMTERDKKKCPETWPKSESKAIKLIYSTPSRSKSNSKLRQSRLNVVKVKSSNIIDITCSPEFSGGSRTSKSEAECNVQPLIKKESIENDDTILPSPTSGPTNFTLFKSPMKFKKPPLSLKTKVEKTSNIFKKSDQDVENKIIKTEMKHTQDEDAKKYITCQKMNNSATYTQDDSINILHPNRLPANFIKRSPVKLEPNQTAFCDTQSSVSLLQHINKLDDIHQKDIQLSPSKRPLAENINVTNIPEDDELQASMSLLQRDAKITRLLSDNVKTKLIELVEIYDEPTARTRAEKRQLPGWACERCKNFYSELYKDDPDMILKKINECSHHRGVNNPERPKTPPGYWNPRWNVPEDTEEFNRKNNV